MGKAIGNSSSGGPELSKKGGSLAAFLYIQVSEIYFVLVFPPTYPKRLNDVKSKFCSNISFF
jgi:hypothetical protein